MKRSFNPVLFVIILLVSLVCFSSSVFAGDVKSDKAAVEKLVRDNAGIKADWVGIKFESGWAFADAAEKGADGSWARATSLLLKKDGANWKILAKGDPMDEKWQKYIGQMPAKVKKAFDEWHKEHF